MAPSFQSQINHSDQPRTDTRRGSSKAQLCLQKILHIILTIPSEPTNVPNQPSSKPISQNDIKNQTQQDSPPPQTEDPLSPATADEGLAANVEEKAQVVNEEIGGDKKGREKEEEEGEGEEDCMGLLIQAAKLIFGEIKEDDQKKKKEEQSFDAFNDELSEKQRVNNNKRRNQRWPVDLYEDMEAEPVVRSKRGRTQVLPCKYRDSVLEPLTRVSRSRSGIISNKRRLR